MKVKHLIIALIILAFSFTLLYASTMNPKVTPSSCEVTGTINSTLDTLLPISCPNGKIFDAKSIGYSNLEGELVLLDEQWVNASLFYDNHFAIVTNEAMLDAIINKRGSYILDYEYYDISYLGQNRYFLKKDIEEETHYYFGQYVEGEIKITEVPYEHIYDFSEGYAAVILKDDDKIGYIDLTGNIKIPFIYERNPLIKHYFYKGRAVVIKDGFYGIINQNNEIIVPIIYDYIEPLEKDGLYMKFCIDGKWGMMDEAFNIVIEPHYSAIGNESENKITVSLNDVDYAFLNLENKELITDFIYKKPSHDSFVDYYNYFKNQYAVVTKDSFHYNIIDAFGEEIFLEEYLGIKMVDASHIILKYEDRQFYLYDLYTNDKVEFVAHDILVYHEFNLLAICTEYYEDGVMIYKLYDLNGNEVLPGLKVYDYMFVEEINGEKYLYFKGEYNKKLFSSYLDRHLQLIWEP